MGSWPECGGTLDDIVLPWGGKLSVTRLPEHLLPSEAASESLWRLKPDRFPEVTIHHRRIPAPRWFRAFGRDYRFSGQVQPAQPVPPLLAPFLTWARAGIDRRLNGILVNWYDLARGHYIGRHRDKAAALVPESSIVTICLGAERPFRLRPFRGSGFVDVPAPAGTVFVMSLATNGVTYHEVPPSRRASGRRISITLRAFADTP